MRPHKTLRVLARRAAVSLLAYLAGRPPAEGSPLFGACVALEPRVLTHPNFAAAHAASAVRGLFKYNWPIKPPPDRVEKMLASPIVRADLALAAAVTGFLPGKRLATLEEVLGEDAIVDALAASDHGWQQLCRLPSEHGAIELRWLARVGVLDYKRYVTLAGRAFGVFTGKRLEAFVDRLPRRHRPAVFSAALGTHVHASDERIATVCKAIAARVDRTTLLSLLNILLAGPETRLALGLVRAVPANTLKACIGELTDTAAARLVEAMTADPPPREHELAMLAAFGDRADPAVVAWCKLVEVVQVVPTLAVAPSSAHRALSGPEIERIRTCTD